MQYTYKECMYEEKKTMCTEYWSPTVRWMKNGFVHKYGVLYDERKHSEKQKKLKNKTQLFWNLKVCDVDKCSFLFTRHTDTKLHTKQFHVDFRLWMWASERTESSSDEHENETELKESSREKKKTAGKTQKKSKQWNGMSFYSRRIGKSENAARKKIFNEQTLFLLQYWIACADESSFIIFAREQSWHAYTHT